MMTDPAAAQQGETTPEPLHQVQHVPVAEVAPHPDNVRAKVGKVDELAASIAEQGVLQPLVVVSIQAFREHAVAAELEAGKLEAGVKRGRVSRFLGP
jgi:ParB-like chromosome segregation protein Spo0J